MIVLEAVGSGLWYS